MPAGRTDQVIGNSSPIRKFLAGATIKLAGCGTGFFQKRDSFQGSRGIGLVVTAGSFQQAVAGRLRAHHVSRMAG